ncbi:hypothetical protein X739_19595 [Mesorhizobium sp. LNHC220B00]|nr:hypothetical protein [Mesorhizobium sp. LNHC220B00]ESY85123.1 hypothetical protein X739_19595 [Mesorhizobium sp. LNHC220B00]
MKDAADFDLRIGIPALAAEKVWCASTGRSGFGWSGWLLQLVDWTDVCIGVTESDMDQVWAMVADGAPIEIEQ